MIGKFNKLNFTMIEKYKNKTILVVFFEIQ